MASGGNGSGGDGGMGSGGMGSDGVPNGGPVVPSPVQSDLYVNCQPGIAPDPVAGGITGHDETSEDFQTTFQTGDPTPGLLP